MPVGRGNALEILGGMKEALATSVAMPCSWKANRDRED
jgi:hypothetical protein